MLNCSISVVCPVCSMINYDQFQTTDHVRICCGCVRASTVIYGFLRSVAVHYGRNEIFEHVENRATKKSRQQKRAGWYWNITVMSIRTRDEYPIDNPGLKPWRFRGVQTVKLWTRLPLKSAMHKNTQPELILSGTVSQCNLRRSEVMHSDFLAENTRQAHNSILWEHPKCSLLTEGMRFVRKGGQ